MFRAWASKVGGHTMQGSQSQGFFTRGGMPLKKYVKVLKYFLVDIMCNAINSFVFCIYRDLTRSISKLDKSIKTDGVGARLARSWGENLL